MEQFLPILKQCKLFAGLADDAKMPAALKCLNARVKRFKKNEVIFSEGDSAVYMGVVLSGEARVSKTDYNGNGNIISRLFPSDIIAASACFSAEKRLPFDIVCASACEILCLDISAIIRPCHNACAFHAGLIKNTIDIIAERNIRLSDKIDILTKRTIREKILAFLFSQSHRTKGKSFAVTMTRRQMAEYLSINRSALSRELCKMRDEGILEFEENIFRLL